jgi:hypothetical protein
VTSALGAMVDGDKQKFSFEKVNIKRLASPCSKSVSN